MRRFFIVILVFLLNSIGHADSFNSLTLTNAEMQKLKKYFPSEENSHLIWKGDPISIALPLNKEKRVVFPDHVSVDVKNTLTSDQLRVLNNDKSLYLTALKSFSTTRIYITLKATGEVVLIDVVTDPTASNTTQQIDIKQNNNAQSEPTITASSIHTDIIQSNEDVNFADLIRFAWQQAYAPERLIKNAVIYSRAPMHTEKFISDLILGDKVIAYPEGSWVAGNYYVTAIYLRNKYPHKTQIQIPTDICGDWQAATLYPNSNLKPYGDKSGDSAMLFLVSTQSFGETLGVCHGDA